MQPKVQALVAKTASMEVTITNSDTEALLLEFNLIKKHRPRFNVVLRDDKSFPYLHFETQHEFPRLTFYRGSRKEPGRYFGPYPSAGAVRETLQQLQKLFRLRNCDDTYFANRSRPCLQYQIQRCTAPCVGLISKESYARDVGAAIKVLEGRNDEVSEDLGRRMEAAAERLHFEEAAQLRDQLAKLKAVQAQQIVTADIDHDADVIAVAAGNGEYCVALMFIRAGRSLGSTTFFPKAPFAELPEVLAAFVAQYYLERESPPEIIVEQDFDELPLLEATLAQRSGRKVRIASSVRGIRARWLEMMHNNAEQALTMRGLARASIESSLEDLREAFDLEEAPNRIECFDISHTGGTDTVASCVVFGEEGPLKSDYRRFNITGIQPGDDYAAMYQALNAPLQAGARRRDHRARCAAHRWRQRAARRSGRGPRRTGGPGNYADRRRQGRRPAARPGATVLVGPGHAHYTGAGLASIASDSARARRSAPIRDHGTPAQAGQASQPVDT